MILVGRWHVVVLPGEVYMFLYRRGVRMLPGWTSGLPDVVSGGFGWGYVSGRRSSSASTTSFASAAVPLAHA